MEPFLVFVVIYIPFCCIEKQKSLSGVVPAIEKARLYRGKGGEIMRSAVSRFIQCLSLSEMPLNEKAKRTLLGTLNENLKHPNAQIQVKFLCLELLWLCFPKFSCTGNNCDWNPLV